MILLKVLIKMIENIEFKLSNKCKDLMGGEIYESKRRKFYKVFECKK